MEQRGFDDPDLTTIDEELIAPYDYATSEVHTNPNGTVIIIPKVKKFQFKTNLKVPRTGVLIVGLGGNNGTTLTAGVIANRKNLVWQTLLGSVIANYIGSLSQCATTYLDQDQDGKTVVAPLNALLPLVNPNDLIIGGWDISSADLLVSTRRTHIMEPDLIRQIAEDLAQIKPLPAVFDLSFVAPNQKDRADNLIPGNKWEQLETVRAQIREFRTTNKLDQLLVLWSANTERYCVIKEGVHSTPDELLAAIKNNDPEISPPTIYCVASLLAARSLH
jgi:myo-inositol-1-phosphate synthase